MQENPNVSFIGPKVPFFFFPGKSLKATHSLKMKKSVFFFPKIGKFPGKVYKSLTQFFLAHIFLLIYKGVYTHGFFAGRGKGHSVL